MSRRTFEPPDDLFEPAAQLALVPEAPPSTPPASEAQMRAAESMVQFVGKKLEKGPRKQTSVGPTERARLIAQAVEMGRSGNWTGARPNHLVALYMWLHEGTYGVLPGELEIGTTFVIASHHAKRFLETHFKGEYVQAVDFMKWAWKRETWRHQHRRAEDAFRITWKYQFGGGLITDWRIDCARAHSA